MNHNFGRDSQVVNEIKVIEPYFDKGFLRLRLISKRVVGLLNGFESKIVTPFHFIQWYIQTNRKSSTYW